MRKNWRELSKEMIEAEERGLHFSHFFWNNDAWSLFVKYQAKAKKTVSMLALKHASIPRCGPNYAKKKPKLILFYNKNKVGWHAYTPYELQPEDCQQTALNAWLLYKNSTQKQIT